MDNHEYEDAMQKYKEHTDTDKDPYHFFDCESDTMIYNGTVVSASRLITIRYESYNIILQGANAFVTIREWKWRKLQDFAFVTIKDLVDAMEGNFHRPFVENGTHYHYAVWESHEEVIIGSYVDTDFKPPMTYDHRSVRLHKDELEYLLEKFAPVLDFEPPQESYD